MLYKFRSFMAFDVIITNKVIENFIWENDILQQCGQQLVKRLACDVIVKQFRDFIADVSFH